MNPLILIGSGLALWAAFGRKDSDGGGASPVVAPPPLPGGAPPPPGPLPSPPVGPKSIDQQRLDASATLARLVAANLQNLGGRYDKALLQKFQVVAGLQPDGVYGPKSAGALKWYTGLAIPPHVGSGFAPYAPPANGTPPPAVVRSVPSSATPSPVAPPAVVRTVPAAPPPVPTAPVTQVRDRQRLDAAAAVARLVAADLQKNGKRHGRPLLKKFQQVAGLTQDGIYGPKSAGALKWYTGLAIPPFVGKGFATYMPSF